ncbi:MAG: pantothenate synthase [Watsoniomyces obsoletus]|nr:MAG: pantothenate synthase [Watsoniomyces obsoletus]
MALAIFRLEDTLYVAAGYESGHVMLFQHHVAEGSVCEGSVCGKWQRTYVYQSHSQPVLSLAVAPSRDYILASAADSNIAQHPVLIGKEYGTSQQPLMRVKTGHSGQQGLTVRSDGKIFATAGWDARIRVYSTATMNELAVLKWHTEGCYATAFAEVKDEQKPPPPASDQSQASDVAESSLELESKRERQVRLSERRRSERAQSTHWLAGGSKDGKISLWDIY